MTHQLPSVAVDIVVFTGFNGANSELVVCVYDG